MRDEGRTSLLFFPLPSSLIPHPSSLLPPPFLGAIMRLIWRELAGWLLVVFGLVLAGTCLQLLGISQFLIAGVVGIAALGVLLGGGLLLGSLSLEVAGWLLVLAGV